jgi:hypothetical protein
VGSTLTPDERSAVHAGYLCYSLPSPENNCTEVGAKSNEATKVTVIGRGATIARRSHAIRLTLKAYGKGFYSNYRIAGAATAATPAAANRRRAVRHRRASSGFMGSSAGRCATQAQLEDRCVSLQPASGRRQSLGRTRRRTKRVRGAITISTIAYEASRHRRESG